MILRKINSYTKINKNFTYLWLFHLFSLFGSEMTRFAIPIWVFQKDQNLFDFSILTCVGLLPRIFLSAISGGVIDQLNLKKVLMFSCLLGSLVLGLLLAISLNTIPYHFSLLCLIIFFMSCFGNIIHLSTLSILPKLNSKDDLQYYNGLMISAESSAIILTPAIAGFLMVLYGFSSIICVDISLMIISIIMINKIKMQNLESNTHKVIPDFKIVFDNISKGYIFIKSSEPLIVLLKTVVLLNFLFSFSFIALIPLILLESNNNTSTLGIIISIASCGQLFGALCGGLIMKAIPKTSLIFKSIFCLGIFGPLVIGIHSSIIFWVVGYTFTLFLLAIINTTNQTLWQIYAPDSLQGTIFGIRRTISSVMAPLGTLLFPFALDYLFIPFQPQFFKNPYQLVFILTGISISITGLFGYYHFKKLNLNSSTNMNTNI